MSSWCTPSSVAWARATCSASAGRLGREKADDLQRDPLGPERRQPVPGRGAVGRGQRQQEEREDHVDAQRADLRVVRVAQVDPGRAAFGSVGAAARPDRLQRLRVGPDVVVGLAEVLDHHLPVPGVLEDEAVADLQACQMLQVERRWQRRQRVRQRRRSFRQAREHPAAPFGGMVARQVAGRQVRRVHEWRGRQPAIQAIGPEVIGAADRLAARLTLDQRHAAVSADVGERVDLALAVARHQHRLRGHQRRPLRACARQLVRAADRDPGRRQPLGQLALEARRRMIVGGRQR